MAARFGRAPTSVTSIEHGHINDSYLVTSAAGDIVLQRINEGVFGDLEGMTANIVVLHRHLHGAMVPRPLPAPDGSLLLRDEHGAWRAFARVAGAEPVAAPTPEVATEAGRFLGRFHRAVADLDPSLLSVTLPAFHDPRRRLAALEEAVGADPCHRAARAAAEIELARAGAPLADLAEELTRRVPRRAAHNDTKLNNFLFRAGAAVCLVDLDTVMPGAWFWDVGDLVRSAATRAAEDDPDVSRAVIDPDLHRAVLAGYGLGVSQATLQPAEADAVAHAGAIAVYEQAVRFLTDWLTGDRYFRTARPGHNLDRARNQFALLRSMPGVPWR